MVAHIAVVAHMSDGCQHERWLPTSAMVVHLSDGCPHERCLPTSAALITNISDGCPHEETMVCQHEYNYIVLFYVLASHHQLWYRKKIPNSITLIITWHALIIYFRSLQPIKITWQASLKPFFPQLFFRPNSHILSLILINLSSAKQRPTWIWMQNVSSH